MKMVNVEPVAVMVTPAGAGVMTAPAIVARAAITSAPAAIRTSAKRRALRAACRPCLTLPPPGLRSGAPHAPVGHPTRAAGRRATRTATLIREGVEIVISDTYSCIFVHIPKCGGSSIETVLWPGSRTVADLWMGFVDEFHNPHQTGGLQHLHAAQIRAEVGKQRFDAYLKFAFVRNPFDRIVSQFASMRER